MRSRSEEDYLKAIYSLWKNENPISTTDIANHLKMKASSVTDMLQKLSTATRIFDKMEPNKQPC